MCILENQRKFIRSLVPSFEENLSFSETVFFPDGLSLCYPKNASYSVLRGYTDLIALRKRYHSSEQHFKIMSLNTLSDYQSSIEYLEYHRLALIGGVNFLGMRQNIENAFDFYIENQKLSLPFKLLFQLFHQTSVNQNELLHWFSLTEKSFEQLKHSIEDQYYFHQLALPLYSRLNELSDIDGEILSFHRKQKMIDDAEEEMAKLIVAFSNEDQVMTLENKEYDSIDWLHQVRFELSKQWIGLHGQLVMHGRYDIFSIAYDKEVRVISLFEKEELLCLYENLKKQYPSFQHKLKKFAYQLHKKLMIKRRTELVPDHSEGVLDRRYLSQIIANPYQSIPYQKEVLKEESEVAITLLIDSSASMAGKNMVISALCADMLMRIFESVEIAYEVLGFTTTDWQGAKVMVEWNQQKKKSPGRLNSLEHIIYRSFEDKKNQFFTLGMMMKESHLKENIDGEALFWAHNRLVLRKEKRKILMVISDGLPMDIATLQHNDDAFLNDHLRHVVGMIDKYSDVELIGIGIEQELSHFYQKSIRISSIDSLGEELINQFSELLV